MEAENKTIEDLKQSAINYLCKKLENKNFINEFDVKIFEIIYEKEHQEFIDLIIKKINEKNAKNGNLKINY